MPKQTNPDKASRVTNVQVPGESPSSPEVKAEVSTATTLAADDNPSVGKEEGQGNEGAGDAPAAGPSAEDHAALQAENEELRAQIAAAGRAPAAGREPKQSANRRDYLNMRAEDVDPSTLTKAVLTKDGWVCPPQIAQTQPK